MTQTTIGTDPVSDFLPIALFAIGSLGHLWATNTE